MAVPLRQLAAMGMLLASTACAAAPSGNAVGTVKVGALFPLSGPQAALAKQEYAGVQIARDLVNADGGVDGAPISLIARDLTSEADASARVQDLNAQGVQSILGAYSSSLSMPVSAAAQSVPLSSLNSVNVRLIVGNRPDFGSGVPVAR